MSDLVRVLRGQRIDGRGADEIMRRAADEIDRLRVIEQTEAAMRRRLEEAVADCEKLREKLADRIEERDDSNRNLTAALQRESKLQAWLAEAERNEETLLGMIRHQRDVLRECLPYINESMAGRRPGRSADDIRAAVKALTSDSASAVQSERCCLDYPRCDCNSPPEPDNEWHCSQYPGCECFAGCREKALEGQREPLDHFEEGIADALGYYVGGARHVPSHKINTPK